MSSRTVIVICACPGPMLSMRIPSAREARSLASMLAPTRSASACASEGVRSLAGSPHACGFAAALSPGGRFAPWSGPAALMDLCSGRAVAQRRARRVPARDQRRKPVAILAVMRSEVHERVSHARDADLVRPAQRPARIVDALLHREVDVARRRDAVRHRVRGLVSKRYDGSQDDETR